MSRLVIVAGVAATIGLAGCSGSAPSSQVASLSGGASASAPAPGGAGKAADTAQQDAFIKYAQCMRQHGINMPDPKSGQAMEMPALNPQTDPNGAQKMQAAATACDKDLPNGGKPTAADLQQQLKLAQCMRQHGVKMADPTAGGSRISINLNDPTMKAALQACGVGTNGG